MSIFTNLNDYFKEPEVKPIHNDLLTNVREFQIGSGGKNMRADSQGLWLGADKFIDAPFSVDMDGNMKATSGAFSGNISASTITGGNINGSVITGSVIRTSANGKRVVIDGSDDDIKIFNSSNEQIMKLDEDGIDFNEYGSQYVGIKYDTGALTIRSDEQYVDIVAGDVQLMAADSINLQVNFGNVLIQADSLDVSAVQSVDFGTNCLIYLPKMSDSSDSGATEKVGSMYYNENLDKVRVKTSSGWKSLQFE